MRRGFQGVDDPFCIFQSCCCGHFTRREDTVRTSFVVSPAGWSEFNNVIRAPPCPIILSPGNQFNFAMLIVRHGQFSYFQPSSSPKTDLWGGIMTMAPADLMPVR